MSQVRAGHHAFTNAPSASRSEWLPHSPPTVDGSEKNAGVFCPDDTDDLFTELFTKGRVILLIYSTKFEQLQGTVEELPLPFSSWKDVTAHEMSKFIVMSLYMEIVKKPEVSHYWSTSEFYATPFFHQPICLPRDSFQQISSLLHFYDCTNFDASDPLAKARPFITCVSEICRSVYMSKKELSVDEELVLFRGRVLFRQYMPAKVLDGCKFDHKLKIIEASYIRMHKPSLNVQLAGSGAEHELRVL